MYIVKEINFVVENAHCFNLTLDLVQIRHGSVKSCGYVSISH